jgi:hypothetical protein
MSVVPPLSTGYEAWLPLSIDITSDHQCISTLIKERKHNWTCRELNTTILEQLEEAKPSFHTKRVFGNEVAFVFLTKRRCNPFGKVKKQFSIHETHGISAFKTQEKKKQMNPASCALPAN